MSHAGGAFVKKAFEVCTSKSPKLHRPPMIRLESVAAGNNHS